MSSAKVSNPILTINSTEGIDWNRYLVNVSSDIVKSGESASSPVSETSTSDDTTSDYTRYIEWEI